MKKSSQIQSADATAIPQCVSVAMAEIAENMHEGLLALAVGAGLQVMAALMEADVSALAGPKGKHDATRTAVRHGRERGSVTLGGRRVAITRPRVRAAGGSGELPIASYELFSSTEILGKMAMEKMLAGLSTRRYPVGLEPVGQQVDESCSATSKSAVSRKFVAMTETALAELLSRDLSGLDLVALMIDGVHFAESCCVVALGIGIDGVKHPLALVEGSTENATLVTGLLVDLRERGLDVTRPMLVVPRRVQGAAQGRPRRAGAPSDPTLPTAQGSERERSSAATPSVHCRPEDDRRLPCRIGAGGRGRVAGPGHRTRPHPPRGGGQPA